jgi:hypothetical protein
MPTDAGVKRGDVSWIQSPLLFVFGVGYGVGYGVREWKSRKRRRRYAYLREAAVEAPDVLFRHPERDEVGRHLAA